MDPLSILVSAITLTGATLEVTRRIVRIVKAVRSAPADLLCLNNEVSDFAVILSNIQESAIQERALLETGEPTSATTSSPAATAEATTLTQRARTKLLDVEAIVTKATKNRPDNSIVLQHRIWIRERGRLKSLREELKDAKYNLALYFSTKSSTFSFRNTLLLDRVLIETAQYSQIHTQQREHQAAQAQLLQEILRQFSSHASEEPEQIIQEETDDASEITASAHIEQTHTISSQQYTLASANAVQTGNTTTETTISSIKMEFSRFQKKSCSKFCSCSCHYHSRYRTPLAVNRILGSLFIGLSNLPLLAPPCSEPLTCTQRSPFSATFTYQLPGWLIARAVSIVFAPTIAGDPAICLKIRHVNRDFSIFRMASIGDVPGIRWLLKQKLAHPSATYYGGWTPLHYAISYGHAAVCKLLLAEGADQLIEDGGDQLSALEWAQTKILGRAFPKQKEIEFQQIFNDQDCLEEFGFTVLHKIIFGHLKRSLETELQNEEHLACINKTDSLGRTALSWAAQRADLASVQTLLRNGADPNICSTKNHAPLHYAAEAQSPSCILPLLLHGAEVGKVDREGQSALHYATMHTSDLEYYRPLVEAGIPVDGKTIWGLTPMMQLSELNRVEATRYLLDNGADINLKGQDGKTPIFLAVEYNSHETLQLLWERGADFAVKVHADHGGMTIVHFAARFADVETLKILTGFKIAVDDLDVLTPEGLTIPQVVEERLRAGNITGFGEAFTCLCQSLRQPDVEIENNTDSLAPGARESIEDTEDDQFFDSFEYIT